MKLPEQLLNSLQNTKGFDNDAFVNVHNSEEKITSLRLNPYKPCELEFERGEKVTWCDNAYYLKERPSFTFDPLFHAGCYYVQDASSQFLEIPFLQAKKILNRQLRVLDLCAAPGGKSTHILSMLNEQDILVSNEIIPSRNNILRQNIIKWGCANVIVTQNETSKLSELKNLFDIIVIDAPCSGEGLFRKDHEAINEWSVENVNRCAIRQNEILDHAYSMLKPDGFLIYSTCTFEKSENDDQVSRLAEKYGMILTEINYSDESIIKTENGFSFYPHRIKGEGFYISLLRKNSDENFSSIKTSKSKDETHSYLSYLKNHDEFTAVRKNENLFAIPITHIPLFKLIRDNAYVRLAGINLGELKGKDFIPSESLALSIHNDDKFRSKELSKDDAIEFLRGGNPVVDGENGFVLMKYLGHSLGWVKKIGVRVNNYYPKEWRIRMR